MAAAGLLLVSGALATAGIGQAAGDAAPVVFSGEATASGVRVTIQAPEAPLTNTPFDAGAPTAYAQLDTIGGTSAYAAYPFPGTVFQSGPGIAVGLLNQSGVPVPSPPGFPNYVASDSTTPSAESGSGPYHLKATSSPTKADALATGGIHSDGNAGSSGSSAGLATATATVESLGAAAGAVATAVSSSQALTTGPLTIGSVRSRVTVKLTADGTATPTTELAVTGVRIAGVPVSVTQDGLAAAGTTVPFTTDPALTAALAKAGLTAELVAGWQLEKGAIAPAVRITAPVPTPGLGNGTGTLILVLGGASAAFSSFVPPVPDVVPPVVGGGAGGGAGGNGPDATAASGEAPESSAVGPSAASRGSATGASGAFPALAPDQTAGTGSPTGAAGAGAGSAAGPADVALRPGGAAAGRPVASLRDLSEPFDIRHLYLAAAALTLLILGLATLLGHLGVRSP
jgi:hypothetical protein